MLEMEHVTFRYSKETPVILSDVSVSFGKGEFIAVTGRNGSGKTMLMKCICGFIKPTSGVITVDGKQVGRAMADTDISELADAYPRTLSRGDQQRVAIASGLAMNTEYLVLDEPTSGQDGREKKKLMSLMDQLKAKGITILLVTHDMDVVTKNCTRVIVVANKEIVFDGVPSDLFSEENRPGIWGLTYPPAVLLGRCLPGAPYCKDMDTFCAKFLEIRKERVR